MTNKKNVILTAILCGCLLTSFSTNICFATTTKVEEPNSLQTADSWFNTDFSQDVGKDAQQGLVKRFFYVISFVVLLGIAAYYVTKKLLPKLTVTQGKNISVIETVHLGPQKLLHLIKVCDKHTLLVSSTHENINLIADITESLSNKIESEIQND